MEHGVPKAEAHSGWEHRAAWLPLALPHTGNASIGGIARVSPDFGTPLQHISPHQRGLCMLEIP